jgi:hypothetical protein
MVKSFANVIVCKIRISVFFQNMMTVMEMVVMTRMEITLLTVLEEQVEAG